MPAQPLQIAVFVDSLTPEAWVRDLVCRLVENERLQIVQVLSDTPQKPTLIEPYSAGSTLVKRIVGSWINKPRFSSPAKISTPLNPSSLTDNLANTGPIDVILHLGQNLHQTNLPHARHGIWHVHQQELMASTLSSLLDQSPTNTTTLWQYPIREASTNENQFDDATLIAHHALPRQSYSIDDLLIAAFSSLPALFESRLNWLWSGHNPAAYERAQTDKQYSPSYASAPCAEHSKSHTVLKAIKLWWCFQKQRVIHRTSNEQWQLAYTTNDTNTPEQNDLSIEQYLPLEPPNDRMWADPHILQSDGNTYIYFEDLKFADNKGVISVASLTPEGFVDTPITALEKEHHLSYPFVFSHDGQHYMIPETAKTRCISLYRCTHLPEQWEFVRHLVEDIDASDTTLTFHDDKWWLFTSGMSHQLVDERDQLLVWHSDSLDGQWQPHPMNPVVTGVDRARMAGPLFVENDCLYRPSQYGAVRYGYGYNFSRIETLTTTDYRETLTNRQTPLEQSLWQASHTFSKGINTTVIDRMKLVKKT